MANNLNFLPPQLRGLYNQMLAQLAGGVSQDERNALNLAAKSRERGLIDRFRSQMAARGLGGGLGNRGQLEISRGISNELFGNMAKADAAARSEAVRAMLGLGDISAKHRSASAAMLGARASMVGAQGQNRYYDWLRDQQILAANAHLDATGITGVTSNQVTPGQLNPVQDIYETDQTPGGGGGGQVFY
jgi:hypothetical protein